MQPNTHADQQAILMDNGISTPIGNTESADEVVTPGRFIRRDFCGDRRGIAKPDRTRPDAISTPHRGLHCARPPKQTLALTTRCQTTKRRTRLRIAKSRPREPNRRLYFVPQIDG